MKFISLFTGIGSFDFALENAGFECDTVCEIDKNAQRVLRLRFPHARMYDDVRKVGLATHEKGSIDLICGGPPCQDFSVAGKRQGIGGERSGLWFEFSRVIDELEPRWVIFENVPGIFSSWSPTAPAPREVEVRDFDTEEEAERWSSGIQGDWIVGESNDFETIVSFFQERGYGVAWRTLDSQYFGVPQRRRRVFLVASLGEGSCCEVLFERECLPGNPKTGRETGEVSPALSSSGAGASRTGNERTEAEFLVTFDWQSGGDVRQNVSDKPMLQANQVPAVASFGGAQITSKESRLRIEPGMPAPTLNSEGRISIFMAGQGAKAGGIGESETTSPTLKGSASGLNQVPSIALSLTSSPTSSGRLDPSSETFIADVAPTLTSGYASKQGEDQQFFSQHGDGEPVTINGVRRLTPTEAERLQGLPDSWTLYGLNENGKKVQQSDSARYKQLGNAVTRNPVEWIAKRIWNLCNQK